MATSKTRPVLLAPFLALAAVAVFAGLRPSAAQEGKPFRWTTSPARSYGSTVAATLAKLAERAWGGEYTTAVVPFSSPIVAMKAAMNGDGEIAYATDIAMAQFHDRSGGFKEYQPAKAKLVHTWYAYSVGSMIAVAAKNSAAFKCWRDFSGKPVFFTPLGFMNWLNFERIFKVLGYDFNHVQIDVRSNADALDRGRIAGSVAYAIGGRVLPPYWKETVLATDIRIVNPCPDEVEKLNAAGVVMADVDQKAAFGRDVGPTKLKGARILFGYNARRDVPADAIYKMVGAFDAAKQKMAEADPIFGALAKDFVGLQAAGINANPRTPVHPGLARFLKERGVWNDRWKIDTGQP